MNRDMFKQKRFFTRHTDYVPASSISGTASLPHGGCADLGRMPVDHSHASVGVTDDLQRISPMEESWHG